VHQQAFSRGQGATGERRVYTEIFHVCLTPLPPAKLPFRQETPASEHREPGAGTGSDAGFQAPLLRKPSERQGRSPAAPFSPRQHSSSVSNGTACSQPGSGAGGRGTHAEAEPAETAVAFLQANTGSRTPLRLDTGGRDARYRSPHTNSVSEGASVLPPGLRNGTAHTKSHHVSGSKGLHAFQKHQTQLYLRGRETPKRQRRELRWGFRAPSCSPARGEAVETSSAAGSPTAPLKHSPGQPVPTPLRTLPAASAGLQNQPRSHLQAERSSTSRLTSSAQNPPPAPGTSLARAERAAGLWRSTAADGKRQEQASFETPRPLIAYAAEALIDLFTLTKPRQHRLSDRLLSHAPSPSQQGVSTQAQGNGQPQASSWSFPPAQISGNSSGRRRPCPARCFWAGGTRPAAPRRPRAEVPGPSQRAVYARPKRHRKSRKSQTSAKRAPAPLPAPS